MDFVDFLSKRLNISTSEAMEKLEGALWNYQRRHQHTIRPPVPRSTGFEFWLGDTSPNSQA